MQNVNRIINCTKGSQQPYERNNHIAEVIYIRATGEDADSKQCEHKSPGESGQSFKIKAKQSSGILLMFYTTFMSISRETGAMTDPSDETLGDD